MDKKNIVFTTNNLMEANLIKSLLESNEIDVFMLDENISRINPFYSHVVGGIKLAVPDHQITKANEILKEYREREGQDPNWGMSTPFNINITQTNDSENNNNST